MDQHNVETISVQKYADLNRVKLYPPKKALFGLRGARSARCARFAKSAVCCEVRGARGLGSLLRGERCARSARWEVRDLQGLWKANSITAQYSQ